MARIVIILAVIAAAFLMWFKIKNAKAEEKKKLVTWAIIGVVAVLGVLVVTGRLGIITAMIGSLIALLPKAIQLLRYLPLINRFRQQASQQQNQRQQPDSANTKMTRTKASEILSIKADASKEEIITAHRRMMQKVHPDRGGSDYLAAEINRAKDTLLG